MNSLLHSLWNSRTLLIASLGLILLFFQNMTPAENIIILAAEDQTSFETDEISRIAREPTSSPCSSQNSRSSQIPKKQAGSVIKSDLLVLESECDVESNSPSQLKDSRPDSMIRVE